MRILNFSVIWPIFSLKSCLTQAGRGRRRGNGGGWSAAGRAGRGGGRINIDSLSAPAAIYGSGIQTAVEVPPTFMQVMGADGHPTSSGAAPSAASAASDVASEPAAAADAAPEAASAGLGSTNDSLRPAFGRKHYVEWRAVDNVTVDPAANNRYNRNPRFNWAPLFGDAAPDGMKDEVDYVKLMLPIQLFDDIVTNSNSYIAQRHLGPGFTKFQFLRFIGIRVVHALEQQPGSMQSRWSKTPHDRSCLRPPCYRERFHVPRNEFDMIMAGFRLDDFVEGTVGMVSRVGSICIVPCTHHHHHHRRSVVFSRAIRVLWGRLRAGPIQTHSKVHRWVQ